MRGWSQDGRLGGRRIRVSALGHLPGTGGGPWTPKRTGGTPSDWVGCAASGGVKGEKWRWDGTGAPEGRLGERKGSHAQRGKLGNTGRAEDQKGAWQGFPCPLGPPRSLLRSWA